MPVPVTYSRLDLDAERHALRRHGFIGAGQNGNRLFAVAYGSLPPEARTTIARIVAGGPFPHPGKDGVRFGNLFGDLPGGEYLEFTVPTPGVRDRGRRRLVARRQTGVLFFTACHYERVGVEGAAGHSIAVRVAVTEAVDADYRNGFYVVTGMTADLRAAVQNAVRTKY